ncbi:major capsid protein [Comamonas antarctica]|uniref:major capsid protein n=1 Tax=Comamonas antarctica TaxID=2743470 RepID=UPI0028E65A1F|nr:major capsid protein [Comamonas antarctica]
MATLDIFNDDAFAVSQLTQTIVDIPRVPTQLGDEGLFQEYGISSTTMMIERTGSALKLVPTAPRGGVREPVGRGKNKLIPIAAVHIPQGDTIVADEVQNVRAFGSETEVESVQRLVSKSLAQMKGNLDFTLEHMRVGALKGLVVDADGQDVLWDMYQIFGMERPVLDFALDVTSTDMKAKTIALKRMIQRSIGGRRMTGVRVKASESFMDAYTSHTTMKKAWELWQNGQYNREDQSEGIFVFQGVEWQVYAGGTDKADFIPEGKAYAYPKGIPGMFQTAYAPGDYMETVNTIGSPYYANQERMAFNKGVELESQSNPIMLNTLPESVIELRA